MIIDLRIEEPENGFRYTHNVLWHGKLVGQATEVTSRAESDQFTWSAFVQFNDSAEANFSVSGDDIQQTIHCWKPSRHTTASQQRCIAAQYVVLRGQDRNGSFRLVAKDQPVPIPGVTPPQHQQDFQLRKDFQPNVIAW